MLSVFRVEPDLADPADLVDESRHPGDEEGQQRNRVGPGMKDRSDKARAVVTSASESATREERPQLRGSHFYPGAFDSTSFRQRVKVD